MPVRRICPLMLAALLAACSDLGTESFDPMASSQKAQQAFGMVSNNPAVQHFDALSGAFTWTGAPPVLPSAAAPAAASPTDILPPQAPLGKTFVYNSQTGEYTGSQETGAPSNGVRYLLYQVDPAVKVIKLPPVSIGYLDLTNENTPAPNSLGVKAVANNVTVLDYKASGTAIGTSVNITAKGNVADGTGRLDFDLSQNFSPSTGIKVDYKLTAPTPDVSIQVVLTTPPGTDSKSTVTLTLTEGRNKLEVNATGNDAAVEGTVKYNGSTLAKISGTGENPVFTGQSGRQLSAQDLEGLKKLFDFVDQVFEGFDDLLAPTYFVLGFTL